jgi:hypothetical protein
MAKEERGVYRDMEWWTKVRLEVSRGGKKKRERDNLLRVTPAA